MEIEEIISIIIRFNRLIEERCWSKKVGISKQNANTFKNRFKSGSMSPATAKKWLEKAKKQ